jgi:PKHD-type hydroxylase
MAHYRDVKPAKVKIPTVANLESGGGGWPLFPDSSEEHVWFHDVFSEDELDLIIKLGKSLTSQVARTAGGDTSKQRNSSVSFLYPNQWTTWIFERLQHLVLDANHNFFQYDLSSMEEGIQFTEYVAPGQHYNWHMDRGRLRAARKLSMTVQLSNPADYEGGDLELWLGGESSIAETRKRGVVSIFPSYMMHRVTPVTSGTRYSLVCWVSGPKFK